MSVDAVVRVSFNGGDPRNNQAANRALVGHAQNATGSGPFEKVGTALYTCTGGDAERVAGAIVELAAEVKTRANALDFISIHVFRRD